MSKRATAEEISNACEDIDEMEFVGLTDEQIESIAKVRTAVEFTDDDIWEAARAFDASGTARTTENVMSFFVERFFGKLVSE